MLECGEIPRATRVLVPSGEGDAPTRGRVRSFQYGRCCERGGMRSWKQLLMLRL